MLKKLLIVAVVTLTALLANAQAVKPFTCSNVRGCVANQPISPSQVNTPYANIGGLDAGPVNSTAVRSPIGKFDVLDAGVLNVEGSVSIAANLRVGTATAPQPNELLVGGDIGTGGGLGYSL